MNADVIWQEVAKFKIAHADCTVKVISVFRQGRLLFTLFNYGPTKKCSKKKENNLLS